MHFTRIRSWAGRLTSAIVGAVVATVSFSGMAAAAPSMHVDEHYVGVVGAPLTTDGAMAYLHAHQSNVIGSDAGFELWVEPDLPWMTAPTYTSGAASFTVGAGDSTLFGTFEVLDRDGTVVGAGAIDAAFQPVGGLEEVDWPRSSGNVKHREHQVYQELEVSGTVTATIGAQQFAFSLEGADALAADFTAFENAPASNVDWTYFTELGFSATLDDMGIQLAMRDEGGLAITEVVVQNGGEYLVAMDDGSGTSYAGTRFAVDVALMPSGSGLADTGATGGRVTGSATVRPAERIAWSEDAEGGILRVSIERFTVSGSFTVTLDDGTTTTFTMDDANGYGGRVSMRYFAPPR